MANHHRGEVCASFGGKTYHLCLTLGALAELESAFGAEDLAGLAGRFEQGRLSSMDLIRILGCGLRGGGASLTDKEVGALKMEGGLPAYLQVVARLLAVTFGAEEGQEASNPIMPQDI